MSVDYNACLVVGWMFSAEKRVDHDVYDWMCGEIDVPEAERVIGDSSREDWCGVTDYYGPETAMRYIGFGLKFAEWEKDGGGVPHRRDLSVDEILAQAKDLGNLRTIEMLYEVLVGEPPSEPAGMHLFVEVS